ncbi:MAG: hypothetical protein ACP6IP_00045 [Candidatus Njordarchaeia archaeon]
MIEVEKEVDIIKSAITLSNFKSGMISPIFSSEIKDNELLLVTLDPKPIFIGLTQIINIHYTLTSGSPRKMARYHFDEIEETWEFLDKEDNPLGFYVPIINLENESPLIKLVLSFMENKKRLLIPNLSKLISITEAESVKDFIILIENINTSFNPIYLKSYFEDTFLFTFIPHTLSGHHAINLFFYKTKEDIYSSIYDERIASYIISKIVQVKKSKVFDEFLEAIKR